MMTENNLFSIYNVRQPVRRASEFLLGTVKMKKNILSEHRHVGC